jgi:hypothetical protein
MRDMFAKFGTQVETFRYAFVLAKHPQGWDGAAPASGPAASQPAADPAREPSLRRRAGDKQPTYIEVKAG